MSQPASQRKAIVWSYAGLDNSGLAGQLADSRTIEAMGGHAPIITTALTAQNSQQVAAIHPAQQQQIEAQIKALEQQLPADALKVGMLPSLESLNSLTALLQRQPQLPVVYDPVLRSSSGVEFMPREVLAKLDSLLPHIDLLTPNLDELQALTGDKVRALEDVERLAARLLDRGAGAVLVKGGHLQSEWASDYFVSAQQTFWLHSKRQPQNNNRGTGCVLSSAIATALARGYSLEDAVVIGKMMINQALRHAYSLGDHQGPLRPMGWPCAEQDMPYLSKSAAYRSYSFAGVGEQPLGLYPVVERAHWLARLLPLGITTIQLRVKDLAGAALEQEIIEAIKLARQYEARLFINDYWQLAIKHQAYGVHLGQEDLDEADLAAIAKAGLRLGVSTHCYFEVARAHAIAPSYLACGPVYHTDSKQMPWIPHGVDNLAYWQALMASYPWVAIGGINLQRIAEVAQTGVSGIAMISAITRAEQPEQAAQQMMNVIEGQRAADDRV